jgi:hypothetical protein
VKNDYGTELEARALDGLEEPLKKKTVMMWLGHLTFVGEMRNAYIIICRKNSKRQIVLDIQA